MRLRLVAFMQKVTLLFQTVRYMNWRQWKYRIIRLVEKAMGSKKLAKYDTAICAQSILCPDNILLSDTYLADEILQNHFYLLADQEVRFDGVVDWNLNGQSYRLPVFRLNSFGYLQFLSDAFFSTGENKYLDKGFGLMQAWWKANGSKAKGDPWDPYVVATRICNWISFVSKNQSQKYEDVDWHIAIQADYLQKHLEFHLGANHLISEAKALMFAGAYLGNQDMYKRGQKLLFAETQEQFLCDGGHYERSVSYHIEALQQLYEATVLMDSIEDPKGNELIRKMYPMYLFLQGMLAPDGTIPLFNDAASDYPMPVLDFLPTVRNLYADWPFAAEESAYASRWKFRNHVPVSMGSGIEHRQVYEDTGYIVLRDETEGSFLAMDVGENGPSYNQGHAHADALSVLWHLNGQPVLVDSGVPTYAPGEERQRCRGTAAHNTVTIDGCDSARVWGAFRTADRGRAYLQGIQTEGNWVVVDAYHDGYLRCGVLHRRHLLYSDRLGALIVKDILTAGDKKTHTAQVRFHYAWDIGLERDGQSDIRLSNGCRVHCSEPLEEEDCVVSRKLGERIHSKCSVSQIRFEKQAEITTVFLWKEASKEIINKMKEM